MITDEYMINLMRALSVPENKIKDQDILAKILEKIISQEDGAFLISIGKEGGTVKELSQKLNMKRSHLNKKLTDMFIKQGIVHPEPSKDKTDMVWKPTGSLLLHDLVFIHPKYKPDTHKELLDLLDEYYETTMSYALSRSEKPLFRIIPVNETITTSGNAVLPYEEAAKIVGTYDSIAVTDCVCRKRARRCDHPSEVCLSFGMAAEMLLQRGVSRKISKDEALNILRISEQAGLVHCVDNKQKGLLFICNCCKCGCGALRALSKYQNSDLVRKSRYVAAVNSELCIGCGTCVDKCQFDAIHLEEKISINPDKCWGCGNCAINCPENAISLNEIRPADHIPEKGLSFMGF